MKKRGRKKLSIENKGEVIGICYICKKDITKDMLRNARAVKLNENTYRCRSKKCQQAVCNAYLNRKKSRKIWAINPITRVKPNKKKKTRARLKREFKKLKEE
jgi:hypothetical protein